jgi:hypothetical protein
MGLIAVLCEEMCISHEVLARIVGVPAASLGAWRAGGVPLHHHSDFRVLEDLLSDVRERSPLPVRGAIRVAVPELEGASVLDLLTEQGPVVAQQRVRDARHLYPVWASEEVETGRDPAGRSRRRRGRAA